MTIQPLIDVLTRIYDCQVLLLDLAEQKQEVIIRDRTDELSKITSQESRIVKELAELDRQRAEALAGYLRAAGFAPDTGMTLTELTQKVVSAKEKSALTALQAQLNDITARLKQRNKTNTELIESSLAYIDFTLDLLTGPGDDDLTYRNPAASKSVHHNTGRFDTKA